MAEPSNQTPAFEAYNQAERLTLAQILVFALAYFKSWQAEEQTDAQWRSIVNLIFPYVQAYRLASARAARSYYDAERETYLFTQALDLDKLARGESTTDFERFPIFLANYEEQYLRDALEPVREKFQRENTTDGAVNTAAGIVGKQVLNGGRRTLVRAVEKDPVVQGWARVQGGNESCTFCWMLISRGPVYKDADTAGINADNQTAVEVFRDWQATDNDELLMKLMTRWHPNCDCRVVPVFDKSKNWVGKADFLAAQKIWNDITEDYSGTSPGYKTPDKYRAFRKALGDGVKGPGRARLPVPKPVQPLQLAA